MVEYILGAAMMEPDVRIKTNEMGFCADHLKMMMTKRNRLSLGLILESHLVHMSKEVFEGKGFLKPGPKKSAYSAAKILETCFVCDRVQWGMERLLATVFRLFGSEGDFRALFSEQELLCLPHYHLLIAGAQKDVNKRYLGEFERVCKNLSGNYLTSLQNDVSHFCKMFDYRNSGEDADWGNSKDSIERSAGYLTGRFKNE